MKDVKTKRSTHVVDQVQKPRGSMEHVPACSVNTRIEKTSQTAVSFEVEQAVTVTSSNALQGFVCSNASRLV